MTRRNQILTGCAALLALAAPASATKLDLASNVELKTVSYSQMVYGRDRVNQNLYLENATLGFTIKDIRLEKTRSSTMDVAVILQSVGIGSSTNTVSAPQFQDAMSRYTHTDGTPFIREAYVRIYKFMKPNVTATFGRQSAMLGQGIVLSDDGAGFPGAKLEIANIVRTLKLDLFYYRPFQGVKGHNIYGASLYYPSAEGMWNFYHLQELDKTQDAGEYYTAAEARRHFTGLRYFLSYNWLDFDGEMVLQRGQAVHAVTGVKTDYAGHAFMLKGSWYQKLGFFGRSALRLGYGRSSGNPGAPGKEDKAFMPTFGKKYSGVERSGYGAIMGASLYDTVKTSATLNGLPSGISGLNIINIGADLPYKKTILSVDVYKFRASQNITGGSRQIGSEVDLKLTWPLSEDLRFTAIYAYFSPLGAYPTKNRTKLLSATLQAKF